MTGKNRELAKLKKKYCGTRDAKQKSYAPPSTEPASFSQDEHAYQTPVSTGVCTRSSTQIAVAASKVEAGTSEDEDLSARLVDADAEHTSTLSLPSQAGAFSASSESDGEAEHVQRNKIHNKNERNVATQQRANQHRDHQASPGALRVQDAKATALEGEQGDEKNVADKNGALVKTRGVELRSRLRNPLRQAETPSNQSFVKMSLAMLLRSINISITAVENIVGHKYFGHLAILALFMIGLCVLWGQTGRAMAAIADAVSNGWTSTFNGLRWTKDFANEFTAVLHQRFLGAKQSLLVYGHSIAGDNSTTLSSRGASLLCSSPLTIWITPWLGIVCSKSKSSQRFTILDSLNKTAFEMGHWADVSETLIPQVSHFQLATIPLDRQRKQLEQSMANFNTKRHLLNVSELYSKGLYESGDCVYNMSLATDRLVKVMIFNLEDVEDELRKGLEVDFGWWRSSSRKLRRIHSILGELLDKVNMDLLRLIQTIDGCSMVLGKTWEYGADFRHYAQQGRETVEQQIREKRGLFRNPDPTLTRAAELLASTIQMPTESILTLLVSARTRLARHRQKLMNAKSTIDTAYELSEVTGFNQLMALLKEVVGGLSNLDGRMALARLEEKKRLERQMSEGVYTIPPM